MQVGDRVWKVTGDYHYEGTIVAVVVKRNGEVRYVVEADHPAGMLMIHSGKQLAHLIQDKEP